MSFTHYAVVVSSGRLIQVTRLGRLLMVHCGRMNPVGEAVSLCRYDRRFRLLPKRLKEHEHAVLCLGDP